MGTNAWLHRRAVEANSGYLHGAVRCRARFEPGVGGQHSGQGCSSEDAVCNECRSNPALGEAKAVVCTKRRDELHTREATRRLLTAAPLPQTSHARWKLQFAAAAAAAAAVLAHSASRCFFAVQAWKDGSNLERRQQPAATCTNLHQP
ncbi:hypothetical protein PMIN01_09822 [Paraphaeosphaeria minitans]|uniref:Uncharacterized protein n=1 Tax=Paraphaeosphaeria minitans TaxID=565426 RepID=A0A9P6GB67_9PLEO|nr:hypothetical protein PMIN01_09822 [Paraphaeosphaeria minitans]